MYLFRLLFKTFWWKMSKIGQTVLEILTKRLFLHVKCRHFGKIRIFGKWPLGSFYDPPCPLTSCTKSAKSNKRILRNVRKTLYFGPSPGLFLDTPKHEYLSKSIICVKTDKYTYSFNYLTRFHEKTSKIGQNRSWDIDEKVIFAHKMPPLWKIRILVKSPLGLFYDPPYP